MGSGIIFNGGSTGGGGNPFSLGVNLPAPIIIKSAGNNRPGYATGTPNIFAHGQDYVNNQYGSDAGTLAAILPNSRYSGYNNLGGQVSNNIFDTINSLKPKIFLFYWKFKPFAGLGTFSKISHRNGKPIYRGFWSHPPHIRDGKNEPTYTNFGSNKSETDVWANNYHVSNTGVGDVNAYTEWDMNSSENVTVLGGMNQFRHYINTPKANVASAFFNKDEDFFDPTLSFNDWSLTRKRLNDTTCRKASLINTYSARQSQYNIYFAFALVINNPENINQYIVGPMSNVVKQSLVMGINSTNKKIAKGFKLTV